MNGKQQQRFTIEPLLPALDNLNNYEISVFYSIDLKMIIPLPMKTPITLSEILSTSVHQSKLRPYLARLTHPG